MRKLSIIVPVFNVVNYVEECVKSLVTQDYQNCEILLVDDGSTDGSSLLCDELALCDDRIRVFHQENGGLSAARNTGLKNASGYYIGFIDSDDYVSSEMFTRLVSAIEGANASVAICNFEVFNKENKYNSNRYGNKDIPYAPENQIDFYAAALDSSCNRIFRADVIQKNRLLFDDKSVVAQEDYWFQIRLFSHINRIVTLENCMYYYRERGSSITKSHSDGDITKRNLIFFSLTKEYIQKNSNRDVSRFLDYLLVNLFSSSINNVSKPIPTSIEEIVSQYEPIPQFVGAISGESIRSIIRDNSIRDKYVKMTFWMLRNGLKKLFAIFEAVRIKRLRSNSRTVCYFD